MIVNIELLSLLFFANPQFAVVPTRRDGNLISLHNPLRGIRNETSWLLSSKHKTNVSSSGYCCFSLKNCKNVSRIFPASAFHCYDSRLQQHVLQNVHTLVSRALSFVINLSLPRRKSYEVLSLMAKPLSKRELQSTFRFNSKKVPIIFPGRNKSEEKKRL